MNASGTSSIQLVNSWNDPFAQYQELRWKDFVITTRMAKNAPDGAEFLPSKVVQGVREVWRFDKEGRASMVFLREYGDEPVLALSTHKRLLEVLFVRDIPLIMTVKVAGKETKIPARSITALALCKRDLAEDLRREAEYTSDELKTLAEYDRVANEKKIAEDRQRQLLKQQQEEEARQKAAAEQTVKINKILARPEIHCYTKETGAPRRGKPVVKDEWQCLKNGTFCILVASYDLATGEHGQLIESFRVRKEGSRVSKERAEEVQATRIEQRAPTEVEAEDVKTFIIGNEEIMMPVYSDVKPTSINFPRPFAVRVKEVTTLYHRDETGKLRTLGTVRHQASA